MKNKIFLFFLILSPGFWWLILRPLDVFSELVKTPIYFSQRINNVFSEERLSKIKETRWANIDRGLGSQIISKSFYNKGTLLLDEFFSFSTYLSPRLYFQSGDGTNLSPPRVEPIPIILLPFFFWGILSQAKNKKYKQIILLIFLTFFAFVFGHRNFAFLFPTLILSIYFAAKGFEFLKDSKTRKITILVIGIYGLYLGGRVLWFLG